MSAREGFYVSKGGGVRELVREVSKGGYCSVRGLLTQAQSPLLTQIGGGLPTYFNFVYRRNVGKETNVYPNLYMGNINFYLACSNLGCCGNN